MSCYVLSKKGDGFYIIYNKDIAETHLCTVKENGELHFFGLNGDYRESYNNCNDLIESLDFFIEKASDNVLVGFWSDSADTAIELVKKIKRRKKHLESKENNNEFRKIVKMCGDTTKSKGFDVENNHLTQMLLISSEVAEAIENFNVTDEINMSLMSVYVNFMENMGELEKLRKTTNIVEEGVSLKKENNLAEELADIVIRVFSYCSINNIDITSAILDKMEKNKQRPHKHGKKF